jgi:hypothetical protein
MFHRHKKATILTARLDKTMLLKREDSRAYSPSSCQGPMTRGSRCPTSFSVRPFFFAPPMGRNGPCSSAFRSPIPMDDSEGPEGRFQARTSPTQDGVVDSRQFGERSAQGHSVGTRAIVRPRSSARKYVARVARDVRGHESENGLLGLNGRELALDGHDATSRCAIGTRVPGHGQRRKI